MLCAVSHRYGGSAAVLGYGDDAVERMCGQAQDAAFDVVLVTRRLSLRGARVRFLQYRAISGR
jgi:hypothetical protein